MADLKSLIVNGKLKSDWPVFLEKCKIDGITLEVPPISEIIGMPNSEFATPSEDYRVMKIRHLTQYLNLLSLIPEDPQIYIEPDNSMWIHIFHHNNPASKLFSSSDPFSSRVHIDNDRWFCFNFSLDRCQDYNDFYINEDIEFMVKQKQTSGGSEIKIRWSQPKSPLVATFDNTKAASITKKTSSDGYTDMRSNDGGLYYNNGTKTFLVLNSGTNGNWWGATGCWTAYQGGIPGFNGLIVTTGCIDIYLKINYGYLFNLQH